MQSHPDAFTSTGRTVTPYRNASAIGGEYLSAASFLGIAGLVYTNGLDMLWFPVGYTVGYVVLLVLVGAAVAPILDNVTCVLLVAPVTLSVCRRLDLPSAPYLISLILASNIGGMSTLIGDPPNIIIGSRAGLSFTDFLVHSLPLTIILLALFSLWGMTDLHAMNGLKTWLSFALSVISTIIFAAGGEVAWPEVLLMSAGTITGGYLGAPVARLIPMPALRFLIAVVGFGMTAVFFWRLTHGA